MLRTPIPAIDALVVDECVFCWPTDEPVRFGGTRTVLLDCRAAGVGLLCADFAAINVLAAAIGLKPTCVYTK